MKESKKTQIMDLLLDAQAIHLSSTIRFTDICQAINIVRNKAFYSPIGMYSLALYGKSAYLTKPSKKEPRYLKKLARGLYVVTIDPVSVAEPVDVPKPTKPVENTDVSQTYKYYLEPHRDAMHFTADVAYTITNGIGVVQPDYIGDLDSYDLNFKGLPIKRNVADGRAYVIGTASELIQAIGADRFYNMLNTRDSRLTVNKIYDTEGYTDPAYAELLKEGYEAQDRGEQAKFICEDCGAEISVKWILPNPDNRLYPPTIPFVPFEIVVSCNCSKKIALSPLNYVTNLEWIKQYGLEYAFTIKSGDTSYSLLGLAAYRRNGTQWSQK